MFIDLDPMLPSDAAALFEAGRDERIWNWMARGPFESIGDAEAFIEAARARPESEIPFVVRRANGGGVIGSTRYLDIQPFHGSVEIGWTWLHPDYWSTKAAVESEFLLSRAAFLAGATRVWFKTDARNVRAQHALEHLGIVREGVLRKHLRVRDDFLRDSVVYAIVAEEWEHVAARANAFLNVEAKGAE
jgi:RimJ/RimL family protein N-acetyltransferase